MKPGQLWFITSTIYFKLSICISLDNQWIPWHRNRFNARCSTFESS